MPSIVSSGAIVGKKEHEGPLGKYFGQYDETDEFGMPTWEQSESEMQRLALNQALESGNLTIHDVDAIFAGDLMNQCTSSGYGLANFDAQFFGLFGACSTIVEGISLGSMLVDSGKYRRIAAVTSSHNCSAERQFRFPIEYGGQRPPTAQWTVTGAGAFIVEMHKESPFVAEAPMLLASVIPLSTILPQVTWVRYGPGPWAERIVHPAAVAVHWAVGVRWLP